MPGNQLRPAPSVAHRLVGTAEDRPARRIGAIARVAAASVAVVLSTVGVLDVPAVVAWLLAGVWLPAAALVWFALESSGGRGIARRAGPLVDLGVLAAVMVAVPDRADGLMTVGLAIAAAVSYHGGFVTGLAAAATGIGLRMALPEAPPPDPFTIAAHVGLALLLTALFARAVRVQQIGARDALHLRGRAAQILEHVGDAVVVTDQQGIITQHNRAAPALLAEADDELAGQPCATLLALRRGAGAVDCSTACGLLGLPDARSGVEVWRDAGGARRQPLLASAQRIVAPDGTVEVVHSLRDVTALKQAEEAKTLFLATASHELKTPLTVILGYARLLGRGETDPTRIEAVRTITERADELREIVERLLLSGRIDAGRVDVQTTEVDIAAVVSGRIRELSAAVPRHLRLELHARPLAVANRQGLLTVLDHLVDNAVKYSDDGQPVTVEVAATDGCAFIRVVDAGIGMGPTQLAHCFERFWQAETTDVRRFSGTGLGLYIVRSLVEAMGGTIRADSALGRGSTFEVRLPLLDDVSGTADADTPVSSRSRAEVEQAEAAPSRAAALD